MLSFFGLRVSADVVERKCRSIASHTKVAVRGLSPKNEVVNVKKNLAAGFDRVLVATKNSRVKNAVEEQLGTFLTAEERQRVTVILLSNFSFVREILGK